MAPDDAAAPAAMDSAARPAQERAQLYCLLAEVFRAEPGRELLRALRGAELGAALVEAGAELGADVLEGEEAEVLEELATEYARLFLGPGPHIAPCASVHLNGPRGSLWGRATIEARAMMDGAGFVLPEAIRMMPDHVSIELEFMERLCEREAGAAADADLERLAEIRRAQAAFLRTHLARWLPDFCQRVEAEARSSLYRGMAALARAYVVAEVEVVDEEASAPHPGRSASDLLAAPR